MKSSAQHERIVAYLDGELSAEESASVEQQLAADEGFRQELQSVERAWAALDELPMTMVTDDFAQTTIAMVVEAARQDVEAKTIALPVQRRRQRVNFAMLAAVAALLGALAFRVFWQNPNQHLVADLSVVQNVDVYSQFQSVEFLRDLQRHLGEDWNYPLADAEELDARVEQLQLVSSESERKAWLVLIPPDDQVMLRAKLNRFRELTTKQQAELRLIDQQIATAPDQQQLLKTLFGFQQWLNDLPPSEQFGYRELTDDVERAKRVARAMIKAASAERFELNAEQLRHLFSQLHPHVKRMIEQSKRPAGKESSRRHQSEQKKFMPKSRQEQTFRLSMEALKNSPQKTEDFYQVVADALPAEMSVAFLELSERGKKARLFGWMRQQMRSDFTRATERGRSDLRRVPGTITEQQLADFFVDELAAAEKERLLALPNDKMQSRLESLYRGRMPQRDWRGSAVWRGRRPQHPPGDYSPEGRRRGGFDEGHRPGPPARGPRRGPRGGEGPQRRPAAE